VTSPAAPEAKAELSPPTLTATSRSKIPSRFQTTKTRLIAKPGRWTRATATHGAVTPMAMSPRPAGQAKAPGSTPWAYRGRTPSAAEEPVPGAAYQRCRSRDAGAHHVTCIVQVFYGDACRKQVKWTVMRRAKKTRPVRRSDCAVACTLDIIGDRWTLLIVR